MQTQRQTYQPRERLENSLGEISPTSEEPRRIDALTERSFPEQEVYGELCSRRGLENLDVTNREVAGRFFYDSVVSGYRKAKDIAKATGRTISRVYFAPTYKRITGEDGIMFLLTEMRHGVAAMAASSVFSFYNVMNNRFDAMPFVSAGAIMAVPFVSNGASALYELSRKGIINSVKYLRSVPGKIKNQIADTRENVRQEKIRKAEESIRVLEKSLVELRKSGEK